MGKKNIVLLFIISFLIILSGYMINTNNQKDDSNQFKSISHETKNINNRKNQIEKTIYTLNKKEIKQKEMLIKDLNKLLNNNKYLISKNSIQTIKDNIISNNLSLSQMIIAINKIKKDLIEEKEILKNNKLKGQNKELKKIRNDINTELSILNNSPLYNSNFLDIKNSFQDLIKKHYYTGWYFLLLNNNIVKNICNLLNNNKIDNKDNCFFTLSKNYNIDLCLNIIDKKIQDNCFIYKKQYLWYKQFKNIKECLLNNNVKNRKENIEGCFNYFYNSKYENILKDLTKDKELLTLINKQYRNIVILDFVKKYAKVMKDENICNKFYNNTKKEENILKKCKLDTIISIFKESNNIKWLNKIKDTNLKKYLILQYYPNIMSYNSIKELEKDNICKDIKNTKEYSNCKDQFYFKKVRDTYRSDNITKDKFKKWLEICQEIKSSNIKQNCKRYMYMSYKIQKLMKKDK